MLMKLGMFKEAAAAFERAVAINPMLSRGSLGCNLQQCRQAVAIVAAIVT
jgi:hypothetical protein